MVLSGVTTVILTRLHQEDNTQRSSYNSTTGETYASYEYSTYYNDGNNYWSYFDAYYERTQTGSYQVSSFATVGTEDKVFNGVSVNYWYDGQKGGWYSDSLKADWPSTLKTSYDSVYKNSYSYCSYYYCKTLPGPYEGQVFQWDYCYDAWNSSRNSYYYGRQSSIYSESLTKDKGKFRTAYDSVYRNSYSYDL